VAVSFKTQLKLIFLHKNTLSKDMSGSYLTQLFLLSVIFLWRNSDHGFYSN